MEANKNVQVAIYCRVGRREDTHAESAGITAQKSVLAEYVARQGWNLVKVYADDGYSGMNFNRPDFQLMLQDIRDGKINCVATTDLAVLSRNYLAYNRLVEDVLSKHQAHYVAVNAGGDMLNRAILDKCNLGFTKHGRGKAR
ncbi:hypothetical protein BSK66_24885 [Paenibacillus odorifer]|uniref:recombinase family protein n=1 Tax=Paenibacillus TaxID=44249 RepID=UPI0003E2941C|nr:MULTISPECIES: recombinase family protein [Paenibacillus]ETT54673.1 Site-specific recombinase, DNA invertase Pin-like protein [Paenibacillus sp. FSL H8-237]OME50702.1 hypothetical protein BSK66_24885 [Paenibacillus odorifer]SIR50011.1 Resolvase, N terminal domain [Paenibacillus sp. RU4X]SIR59053.1 Resolvase, N terminal domain [Paenibacillus sp. RU4T]